MDFIDRTVITDKEHTEFKRLLAEALELLLGMGEYLSQKEMVWLTGALESLEASQIEPYDWDGSFKKEFIDD